VSRQTSPDGKAGRVAGNNPEENVVETFTPKARKHSLFFQRTGEVGLTNAEFRDRPVGGSS